MVHCVGNEAYWEDVQAGRSVIYSLRDEEGRPHVTIEHDSLPTATGRFKQVYGPENSDPPPEHLVLVREFADALDRIRPLDELDGEEEELARSFGRERAIDVWDRITEGDDFNIVSLPSRLPALTLKREGYGGGWGGYTMADPSDEWSEIFAGVVNENYPDTEAWQWESDEWFEAAAAPGTLAAAWVQAAREGSDEQWGELVRAARKRLEEVADQLVDGIETTDRADLFEYFYDAIDGWAGGELEDHGVEDQAYLIGQVKEHWPEDEEDVG